MTTLLPNMPPGQNAPINLPPGHDIMDTNTMGDCVTLVLLWGLQGNRYANVRGWHGFGGFEAINLVQMFQGVPASPNNGDALDPTAIVLGSTLGTEQYLRDLVRRRLGAIDPKLNIRICKEASRYEVNRNGNVNIPRQHVLTLLSAVDNVSSMDILKFFVPEKHFKADYTRMSPVVSLTDDVSKTKVLLKGGTTSNFYVKSAGPGQLSGVSYTVPAYSKATIKYKLNVPCLTTETVNNLSKGWEALLNASQKEKFHNHVDSDTSASANLSFLGFFSGGGKAETTVKTTSDHMKSIGLSDEQITKAMNMLADAAKAMSEVEAVVEVLNTSNDFPVSGNNLVFFMSGEVTTGNSTHTFRMMSSGGQAGNGEAPTNVDVRPLT